MTQSHHCGNCDGADPSACLANTGLSAQCWRNEPHASHTWTLSPEEGGADCPGIDQPAPAPAALRDRYAAAIASYDHAVGHATNPAPGDHHHGQADAVMAVRDRELEQVRAQVARVRQLAERWENALASDLAYARALRRALNPQEQP